MMNEIHQAYSALGLEPGAPFEAIKRRYRKLVLVWHPDRMTNVDAKREVEEELKKINLMFERLKKHFDSDHKSGPSCRCQAAAAGPPPNNNQNRSTGSQQSNRSSGPSDAERRRREEEETRRRTAERAQEEAARRAAEASRRAEENRRAAEEAVNSEEVRKQENLRWKCSAAVAVIFAGLILYCWLGCAVRDAGRAIGKQWDQFQEQLKPKPAPKKPIIPYYKREAPSRPLYPSPFAPPAPPPYERRPSPHGYPFLY